ncbi:MULTISPECIES: hypothetical protein [Pseudoalteromonas]|uniref:Uncharacterized protein n=1 Tax=Pseudoalteromonas amylolytica TaxID=1859457 RepID=A0A1S1MVV6_9GAMM|nr:MULTISPECIES: hypothetical protein [Pseudoalteromonas]MCF6434458.1 hypothetical protein [Pseudoalteromonas sp. MMG022]OHU85124.1 hypothetical protein BFC16_20850 [Pseudoalteromonas sp. JW3]OHU89925.1 hypothetical protein BET10_14125 [Pseudoalteromonas amylolytica]
MTQRTMKHGDWAKIVESRSKKQQAPAKKNGQSATIIFTLLIGFAIFAMLWAKLLETSHGRDIPVLEKEQKQRISRYFSKQFIMGNWQFYDAEFTNSDINILIEMPNRLAMSEQQLTQYIKGSLCPSTNSRIWRDVNHYNLNINLFVGKPRNGTYAQCSNPNNRYTG